MAEFVQPDQSGTSILSSAIAAAAVHDQPVEHGEIVDEIIATIKHQINGLALCPHSKSQRLQSFLSLLVDISYDFSRIPKSDYLMFKAWNGYFHSNNHSNNMEVSCAEECVENGCEADSDLKECKSCSSLSSTEQRNKNMPFILHREICKLVTEFLVSFHENSCQNSCLENIHSLISKFIKLCRENPSNRQVLYNNQFALILLDGFKEILTIKQDNFRELQTVLLELFVEISLYKIESNNLKLLLNLFKVESAPFNLYLNCLRSIIEVYDRRIAPVIVEIGGINTFMLLFIRIIEVSDDADLQAQALDILYKVCHSHSHLMNTFLEELNCLSLISFAMECSKCLVTIEMMQIFLKFSIIYKENDIRIISSKNMSQFVSSWKCWHKTTETELFFYKTLNLLVSKQNQHRSFNIEQLKKENILDLLLKMLQEMFLQSENLKLSHESVASLVNFLSHLIGMPPDLTFLSDVFDCALLLHKPASAYICNTKKSFYYLFPFEWNVETSHLNLSRQNIDIDEWVIISEDNVRTEVLTNNLNEATTNEANGVITALIDFIDSIISIVPNEFADNLISYIIKFEFLVVLANNNSTAVRESVLKTLCNCLILYKDKDTVKSFLKNKGLFLLANQLHTYQSTKKLMEICFNLILNYSDICLEEMLNFEVSSDFNDLQLNGFSLLFALLPQCVSQTGLCHSSLQYLNTILNAVNATTLKSLYDLGIIESLAKVIIKWDGQNNEGYENDLIYEDTYNCLRTLARQLFDASGSSNYQVFLNMLQFFSIIERKVQHKKLFLRNCQLVIYETAIDEIEKFAQEAIKKQQNVSKISLSLGNLSAESFLNFFIPVDGTLDDDRKESFTLEKGSSFESVSTSLFTATTSSSSSNELGKSPKNYIRSNDLVTRLRDIIVKAVNFILCQDVKIIPSEQEKYFSRTLLHFFTESLKLIEQPKIKKSLWLSILLNSKYIIQSQMCRLVLFLISPSQPLEDRQYVANLVLTTFTFLPNLLSSNVNFGRFLRAFLDDLIVKLDKEQSKQLKRMVRQHFLFQFKELKEHESFQDDISNWMKIMHKTRTTNESEILTSEERIFNRLKNLAGQVSEISMSVTRSVVEAQNRERKQYLYYLKHQSMNYFSLKKSWKSLIDQLTHKRAIWYFPEAYPNSWELDQTEGPLRIRRKLKRCFINIPEKFFLDKNSVKKTRETFSFLFNDVIFDSSALIERLYFNEIIVYNSPCAIITPDNELSGEILISNSCIHFVCESKKVNNNSYSYIFTEDWPFKDIQEVHQRRYQLQNNAIEIFLNNGLTYLIAFSSMESRKQFQTILRTLKLPNLTEPQNIVSLTQMWRERLITNFEYLMQLNKLSGRSHNDLMQYPVFPFVISDYESECLDLTRSFSFRNFSKPIAIQHKEREQYYINQFNYIKSDYERNAASGLFSMPATSAPYHYGSHYSNSGIVLHFLVRMPPFTEMFLTYQDNNFDIPDRTFHSIATTWKLASYESTTDFKELIPEFFYLPEFLMNNEQFNFGTRQNGELVDNVNLPKWCRKNARLFVLINRQALESNYVTRHLNEWIDLVFGYKQTGQHAIEAINVFHPATYYGTDISKIEDPIKRNAHQTMIKTFGQMPRQLFSVAHPTISVDAQLPNEKHGQNVMGEVIGLKWGTFVGSPSEPDPFVVWKNQYSQNISTFVPLSTNDVVGLSKDSCVFLTYNRQKGLLNASYITSGALIIWGAPDGTVKVQIDSVSFPLLLGNSNLDKITTCGCVPNFDLLLVGYASGSIMIYKINKPFKNNNKILLSKTPLHLQGHESLVKSISICKSFLIAITGDASGVCICWDLNRYCFTRTIATHNNAIELICISETLGDVVTVSHLPSFESGSMLMAHTINGEFIGQISTDNKITAVCYSNSPEGISVNVIATGFVNGIIKLWSSWDLVPVREIRAERFDKPISCITYSHDNNRLYVAYDNGHVIVWEKNFQKKIRKPSLVMLCPV